MSSTEYPRVVFPYGLDERTEFEMPLKGWAQVYVETAEGTRYLVYFSDPVRLGQDLESLVEAGHPCFAEPALVVLPEVTVPAIESAVQYLVQQDFFSHLRPEENS